MTDACRGRRADRYSNGFAINATAIILSDTLEQQYSALHKITTHTSHMAQFTSQFSLYDEMFEFLGGTLINLTAAYKYLSLSSCFCTQNAPVF